MPTGQVIKMYNGFYYVQQDAAPDEELLSCRLRGRIKRNKGAVVTGDYVEYQLLDDGTGIIEECLPRRSMLQRPAVANVDQVIITFAACQPDLNLLLLNRFLVLAEWSGIPEIVICINKLDLLPEADREGFLQNYREAGYKVMLVSAHQQVGIDELRQQLSHKVTVFAGPSGVGKSSLLNAIDSNLQLTTGVISDKIKRGKHTTRATCLIPMTGGGTVVDTPGFSAAETELEQLDKEQLAGFFPEFRRHLSACYYQPCSHSHEPNCMIKAAVESGSISQERYDAYLNILQTIKDRKKAY